MNRGKSGNNKVLSLTDVDVKIQEVEKEISRIHNLSAVKSARDMINRENQLRELNGKLRALRMGREIQRAIDSVEKEEDTQRLAKVFHPRMKNQGRRRVRIRETGGFLLVVSSTYWSRNCDRRKQGKGIYPALVRLGIYDRCTPAFASEVSLLAAALSSYEETEDILRRRGIDIDDKTIRRIAMRTSGRARQYQKGGYLSFPESLKGKTVLISVDGGRIRTRRYKKGERTKKKRRRYEGKWREPKMLMIYIVDEDGHIDRSSFLPVMDSTLKGANALFELLEYYLRELEVWKAESVIFIADGAKWIWDRVPKLMKALGVPADRIHELIDFYHGVEHLGKIANLCKKWGDTEKKRWITRQRRRLLNGEVDKVIESIESLCRGRNSKALRTEHDYFVKNRHRMIWYPIFQRNGLPIGSGPIESAIRRVINLKMKGNGIFWCEESAENMLMLRSYYKAGRWEMLEEMSFTSPLLKAA